MTTGKNIEIYRSGDGEIQMEVPFDGETCWLTVNQIAELFDVTTQAIDYHIKNIYGTGELVREITTKEILVVIARGRGGRGRKEQAVNHYNLDMILSVGYRVNSKIGTHFRIWATRNLTDLITKGYTLNEKRLSSGDANFDELVEEIRRLRTSEKFAYEKVRELFATSIDYESNSDEAKQFYATVQNKFHFAIHGKTAGEVIKSRASRHERNMGLTTWEGDKIGRNDVTIAKNYLAGPELKQLEMLVEQFLSYAELRAYMRIPMTMKNWREKLDEFIEFNERPVLSHKGTVSNQDARDYALREYKAHRKQLTDGK